MNGTETILILLGIGIVAIPTLFIYWAVRRRGALGHKAKMEQIVKRIENAPEFVAALGAQGRVSPVKLQRKVEVEVVRRIGLSQAGYPHRCEYCGNPLYINQHTCHGCGAPRK